MKDDRTLISILVHNDFLSRVELSLKLENLAKHTCKMLELNKKILKIWAEIGTNLKT